MEPTLTYDWDGAFVLARDLAEKIKSFVEETGNKTEFRFRSPRCYAVPRGGINAALLALNFYQNFSLTSVPDLADFFVDDLVDSGKTREHYLARAGQDIPFFVLVDKQKSSLDEWVKFPWEQEVDIGPEENIRRVLQYIGEDPDREGLIETPKRVVKSYTEIFSGYSYKTEEDIASVLKVFEDGACDEMVVVKDIEFTSYCEHHMMPFSGVAHIAYLPAGKIIGLSKLGRILDIYARRLQIQERLTTQITTALETHLKPLGSACVIEAKHACMSCRGVKKQNSVMITSSLTGQFREPAVRAEFFSMIR